VRTGCVALCGECGGGCVWVCVGVCGCVWVCVGVWGWGVFLFGAVWRGSAVRSPVRPVRLTMCLEHSPLRAGRAVLLPACLGSKLMAGLRPPLATSLHRPGLQLWTPWPFGVGASLEWSGCGCLWGHVGSCGVNVKKMLKECEKILKTLHFLNTNWGAYEAL
jgi:hypothetical protein